ncbi:MAG: hypothetical protein AAF125_07960, partial [Chloroflexota bacterium]
QTPERSQVQLEVNGAEIRVGSTVVIETPDEQTMVLYTVEGTAFVDNLVVPAGWKTTVPLQRQQDPDALPPALKPLVTTETFLTISGQWDSCERITDEDRVWLDTFIDVPEELLYQPIASTPEASNLCDTPEALAAAVGAGAGRCPGFVATSPLDGMRWGKQDFFWDPAPGATSYRVDIYDSAGNIAGTGSTASTNANVDTGTGDGVGGVAYTWQVTAIDANGRERCATEPVTIPRGAAPPEILNRGGGDGSGSGDDPDRGGGGAPCVPIPDLRNC